MQPGLGKNSQVECTMGRDEMRPALGWGGRDGWMDRRVWGERKCIRKERWMKGWLCFE